MSTSAADRAAEVLTDRADRSARYTSLPRKRCAAQVLGAEVSIPMHYGTFHLGDDDQDEPVIALRRALVRGVRFEVLAPGKSHVAE